MGLAIFASPAASGPVPFEVTLELQCDSEEGGLFPPARAEFRHADGFIGAYAAAMRAGWLDRQAPRGRLLLCPDCSMKTPRAEEPPCSTE